MFVTTFTSDCSDLSGTPLPRPPFQILRNFRDVTRTEAAITEAADAANLTKRQRQKIPKFFVTRSRTPSIYEFDTRILGRRPDFHLLTYLGTTPAAKATTAANRAWVFSNYGTRPAPTGQQLDEFPYASTVQGGPLGPAEGEYVPRRENSRQGGDLRAFYAFKLYWTAQPFLVVPVDA